MSSKQKKHKLEYTLDEEHMMSDSESNKNKKRIIQKRTRKPRVARVLSEELKERTQMINAALHERNMTISEEAVKAYEQQHTHERSILSMLQTKLRITEADALEDMVPTPGRAPDELYRIGWSLTDSFNPDSLDLRTRYSAISMRLQHSLYAPGVTHEQAQVWGRAVQSYGQAHEYRFTVTDLASVAAGHVPAAWKKAVVDPDSHWCRTRDSETWKCCAPLVWFAGKISTLPLTHKASAHHFDYAMRMANFHSPNAAHEVWTHCVLTFSSMKQDVFDYLYYAQNHGAATQAAAAAAAAAGGAQSLLPLVPNHEHPSAPIPIAAAASSARSSSH